MEFHVLETYVFPLYQRGLGGFLFYKIYQYKKWCKIQVINIEYRARNDK